MREILFKAKRTDNGWWIEGYFVVSGITSKAFMVPRFDCNKNFVPVDPETVCQYTGLTDKNGVKIFEGDIVSILDSNRQWLPAPVCFLKDQCQFVLARSGYNPIWMSEVDPEKEFEVVGNIHDKED